MDTDGGKVCGDVSSDMDESEPQCRFWETRHSPTNHLISELDKDNIRISQNIIQQLNQDLRSVQPFTVQPEMFSAPRTSIVAKLLIIIVRI